MKTAEIHRDDDWLVSDRPEAMWVDVTPEMAARWLEYGLLDRKVMRFHVRNLARDMASKRFYPVPDGIAFDLLGNRINGQHRLSAVLECGLTVGMFVFVGLPTESRTVTDTGKKSRSLLHAFQMRGIETAESEKRVCEVANAMLDADGRQRRTVQESLDFAEEHLGNIEAAIKLISSGPVSKKNSVIAVIARSLETARKDERRDIGSFCSVIESGIPSVKDDEWLVDVRDFMMRPLGGGHGERLALMNRTAKALARHIGRRVPRGSSCSDLFPLLPGPSLGRSPSLLSLVSK